MKATPISKWKAGPTSLHLRDKPTSTLSINQIVNLNKLSFDLGIMHYVSDTPYTKGKSLGAGGLAYFGMDSTYAISIAILRRIMQLEEHRLSNAQK